MEQQSNEKSTKAEKRTFFVMIILSVGLTMSVIAYRIFWYGNTSIKDTKSIVGIPNSVFITIVLVLIILDYILINAYMHVKEKEQAYCILKQQKEEALKLLEGEQDEKQKEEVRRKIINADLENVVYLLKVLYSVNIK